MTPSEIIRELVRRTQNDFVSYFAGTSQADRAALIVAFALSGDARLASLREELDEMIPDTELDGRWECSYALNNGIMIMSLIDYQRTGNDENYNEAVTVFFDSVDFKVQQSLEKEGVPVPTEAQIANHPLFVTERAWFDRLVGAQ